MRRLPTILLGLSAAAAAASVAWAQTTPPAPSPAAQPDAPANMKNRKVLPATITRKELGDTMRSFTVALGVKCDFCHARGDFASDANPRKNVARGMIRMAMDINRQLPKIGDPDWKISCYSCHRGATKPALAPTAGMLPAPVITPRQPAS